MSSWSGAVVVPSLGKLNKYTIPADRNRKIFQGECLVLFFGRRLESSNSVEDILFKNTMVATFCNCSRPPNLLFISVSHSARAVANK